ncbi:MFS transporter [Cellulomonas aerilata]|uniref:Putative MFS-type transporter YdeG n=1 Tax=Cellulomonas aerilata TaxID=515326 RepID=A0A512D7S8_9CELL|nr:MFS transporter [Cellulomonas aerilata]GEO32562.1 putative MFS-type transporter YdeG [Cellulomonas aerilata]
MGRHPRIDARSTGVLVASNVLGGVGVASGIAVGGLLAERLGGTSVAGLGQAAGVLGAAVAAVPLAALAARRGRRWSLAGGYAVAVLGAVVVVTSAVLSQLVLLFVGLGLFGVAQAVNLQARYAAADGIAPAGRARVMSVVLWATTIGSVAGPNLTAVGARVGEGVGVPALAGPYLFSVVAFAGASVAVALLFRPLPVASDPAGDLPAGTTPLTASPVGDPPTVAPSPVPPGTPPPRVGALTALRRAAADPVMRLGVGLLAISHAVMVMVMVMTPLHMQHGGMSLELVGVVISLHVLGMYALSPVLGWLADRWGPLRLAAGGLGVLAVAVTLGFVAAASPGSGTVTATALVVLGLGWSAGVIASSAILATAPGDIRLPLQGVTDAGMSYAGAAAAALAGPVLAAGGFRGVNVAAALLLLPALVLLAGAMRTDRRGLAGDGRADRPGALETA